MSGEQLSGDAAQLEKIREIVSVMLDKARDGSLADTATAVQRACDVMKLPLDLDKTKAELSKLALEQSRLDRETKMTYLRERSERVAALVAVMTPLFSVLTVAGTLMFQSWQFRQTEAATRRADEQKVLSAKAATDEAAWNEAIAGPIDSQHTWPKVLAVEPFLRSAVHSKDARNTLLHVMAQTTDTSVFNEVSARLFPSPDWNNIDELVRLDRTLAVKAFHVYNKSWDNKTSKNDISRLSDVEKLTYDYVNYALPRVGAIVGSVLRTSRPKNFKLDLSGTLFKDCDWRETNLRDAHIDGMSLRRVDLDNADLSVSPDFNSVSLQWVAWWEARVINDKLRGFLRDRYPCEVREWYGSQDESFTSSQCNDFNK